MNSINENFEVKDIYELILDMTASNAYFVSEIFWDRVVINEVKLNMLTPGLLQELFAFSWNKIEVDEKMCLDIHRISPKESIFCPKNLSSSEKSKI